MSSPAPDTSPPTPAIEPTKPLADRYELIEVLGRGGMATVWRAHDRRLDRTVAVKVLRPDLPPAQAIRIEREARAAARIDDPRVVTVLDLDHTADGSPFLVMQAHGGRTLADELRAGPLPMARVRRLADDLTAALAAAHECGVLHRDLKPANVLADDDGFRLTDFGIASLDDDLDTNGDLLGTLAYVAPERFDGEAATTRSDVFSAGVVLHEAVTGRQPFRGSAPGETVHRLRAGLTEPLPDDIPPDLVALIERAVRADPARRPADGAALRRLLGVDLEAPTTTISLDDLDAPTERLDRTEVLAGMAGIAEPPAPPPPISTPVLGERLADIKTAAAPTVDRAARALERTADAVRQRTEEGATSARRLARDNPPAAIAAAFAAVAILLLLVAIAVAPGGGDAADVDSPPASPAEQLEADLDRLEELGR